MRGNRNAGYLRAVARLAPGVSLGQADAEVRGIGERLSRTYQEDGGRSAMLVPAREQFYGVMEQPLFVLAAAVAFVLAIACANVASLLLARGAARRRDLALRRALGASRLRVTRQLLTESVVLAAAGGACGVLLGWAGTGALLRLAPDDIAGLAVAPDWRVLLFTAFVALCAGIAFGIVPALQCSRDDLTSALTEGSTRTAGSRRAVRVRDYLVGGEVAVALVLLVGALLLVRSFVTLTHVDTGIDTRNLLTFSIHLTGDRASDQARQVQFYADLQNRLAALPGVTAAGSAATLPIGGDNFGASFLVDGQPAPTPGNEPHAGYQVVMPGYFAAMGIPIERGRDFSAADDRRAAPVVLVNETLARQQWPVGDAVGRRVRFGADQPWATVVGVVRDIRHLGPSEPPRPEIYQPAPQRSFSFMAFVVRTSGDPHAIVPLVRRTVAALDPALAIADVRTMDEHVARALARPRFMSTLITSFSVLALLLAVIGIHGVLAWSVAQQHQEIAIRMALGAASSSVLVIVLRRAALLGAAGIAIGLALAPLATRPLGSMLYGLAPWDPASLAGAALLLGLVTLLAALVPAARASRIQPGSLVKL
jgi:putative ABC transport system permease protein